MFTNRKTIWASLAFLLIIPFVFIISNVFASNIGAQKAKTPIDPYSDMLKEYENELNDNSTSEELSPAKLNGGI